MDQKSIEPLNTGQRVRRKRRRRLITKLMGRSFRNRRMLMVAFWMMRVTLLILSFILK